MPAGVVADPRVVEADDREPVHLQPDVAIPILAERSSAAVIDVAVDLSDQALASPEEVDPVAADACVFRQRHAVPLQSAKKSSSRSLSVLLETWSA